jgi:hypothetical protein
LKVDSIFEDEERLCEKDKETEQDLENKMKKKFQMWK